MNENLDLTTILKDCPKDTKLYSTVYGDVTFCGITESDYPIRILVGEVVTGVTRDGRHLLGRGECVLFPSKDQRDWSKFKVPIKKFDPKTLQPFDKVLARDCEDSWKAGFFSHIEDYNDGYCIYTSQGWWQQCIPYNDDTKHLVGTDKDCNEYYKWWKR